MRKPRDKFIVNYDTRRTEHTGGGVRVEWSKGSSILTEGRWLHLRAYEWLDTAGAMKVVNEVLRWVAWKQDDESK